MKNIMNALRFGQYYGFTAGAVPMVDIMDIVSKMPETSGKSGSGSNNSEKYLPGGLYGADAANSQLNMDAEMSYQVYRNQAEQAKYDMAMNGETPELRKLYNESVGGMIQSQRIMSQTTNNVSIRKDQEAQFRTRRDNMSKSLGKPALNNSGYGYGWANVGDKDDNSTIIDKVIGVTNEDVFQFINMSSTVDIDPTTGAIVPVANFQAFPYLTHNDTKNYRDVLRDEYSKVASNMTEDAWLRQYVSSADGDTKNFGLTLVGGFYVLEHGSNKVGTNESQISNLGSNYLSFLNEEQMAGAKQDAFYALKSGKGIITSSMYNPNNATSKENAEKEKQQYIDKGYRVYEVDMGKNKRIIYSYGKDNIMYEMKDGEFVAYQKSDTEKKDPLTVKHDNTGKTIYYDKAGNVVSDKDVSLVDVDRNTLVNNLENQYVDAYLTDSMNKMHDSYRRRTEDLTYSAALRNEPSINGGSGEKKDKYGATYYMASMLTTSNNQPNTNVNIRGRDGKILGIKTRYSTVDKSVNSRFKDPSSQGSSAFIAAESNTTQAYVNVAGNHYPLKIEKNGRSFLSDYGAQVVNVTGVSMVLPQVQTYDEMQSFVASTIPQYLGVSMNDTAAFSAIFGTANQNDIKGWRADDNTPFYVPGGDMHTMLGNADNVFGSGTRQAQFISHMYTSSSVPYIEYSKGNKTLEEATMQYAQQLQSYNFFSEDEINMLTQFFEISAATKHGLVSDPSNIVNEFTYSNSMLSGPVKIMYGANKYLGQEGYSDDEYNRIYEATDLTPTAMAERNNNAQMSMFGETYQITLDKGNANDYELKIGGLPVFITQGKGEKVSATIKELESKYGKNGLIKEIMEKSKDMPLADAINKVLIDEFNDDTDPVIFSPYESYSTFANKSGMSVSKTDMNGKSGEGDNEVISAKNQTIYLTGYFNHSLDFITNSVSYDDFYGGMLMQNERSDNKLSGYLIDVSKNKIR